MRLRFGRLNRLAYGISAVLLLGVALVPAFSSKAFAYGQVGARYVKMNSSAQAATSVTYEIGFTVATAGAVQGVGVDFCSNSPILGDTCTAPSGFTVGAGTTTGSVTGMTGTWSGAAGQSGRTLLLTLGTPGGTASAGAAATFTLTTATNPNTTNTSFYARIYTFATAAAVGTWNTANSGGASTLGVVDAGGVALSTANQITVTAKVQETLTFCVYTGANCAAGGTAVALGDTNGVLSTAGPFVDKTTKYDVATNAGGASPGVTIRFKAPTLTSGANTINAIGATPATSLAGSNQFGLCSYVASGANLTIDAMYAGAGCSGTTQTAGTGSTGGAGSVPFALDTGSTATTFGDDLATATAGASSTGQIAYLGNVSATKAAGVYTSTFNFVATGTY